MIQSTYRIYWYPTGETELTHKDYTWRNTSRELSELYAKYYVGKVGGAEFELIREVKKK